MTTDPTPESARALLDRHGLPEDVIDGVLCLHAQELAAVQRTAHDTTRPHFHMGQPCRPDSGCHVARVIDVIDPTRTAAVPVAAPTTTEQTALRERIAEALVSWTYRGKEPDPETGMLETVRANAYSRADAVLAVLPAPADRAAERCPSCEHETQYHDAGGRCWFTVEQGVPERDSVCSCLLRRLAVEVEQAGGPSRGATEPQPVGARPCDGCGHLEHRANKCPAIRYGERCACDEPAVSSRPGTEQEA